MCGRFTLTAPAKQIESLLHVSVQDDYAPRYNIAPTQPILTVRAEDGLRIAQNMRWGLIPFWAKDMSIGNKCINARSETAHEKASFREAVKKRRCLIPASGFYEWSGKGKTKTPNYLHFTENLGVFAGLWERWRSPDGDWVWSATILTTTPNAVVAPFHDRMPVVLEAHDFARWLDPELDVQELRSLLVPAADDVFETWEVSREVNSPAHEGADLIARVGLF